MAKLLRHFGFGNNKKSNNSNNLSPSESAKSKFILESVHSVHRSGSFGNRDECGDSTSGASADDGISVDGDLSCSNAVSISGQQVITNNSKYAYQTNSLESLNSNNSEKMKRQNAVKKEANGWTYKSATDGGQLVIDKPQKLIKSNHSLPSQQHNLQPQMHIKVSTTLEDDYSEPLDFCAPSRAGPTHAPVHSLTERHLASFEEDYSEPFQLQESASSVAINQHHHHESQQRHWSPLAEVEEDEVSCRWTDGRSDEAESVYDDVYESRRDHHPRDALTPPQQQPPSPGVGGDDRPGEEYDAPWEWRHIPPTPTPHLMPQISNAQLNHISRGESSEELTMSGAARPRRHIYETAFDSSIKTSKKDVYNDDEIINHPIFTSSSSPPTTTPTKRDQALLPLGILSSDNTKSGVQSGVSGGEALSSSSSPKPHPLPINVAKKKYVGNEHSVRALIHLPPRSANSTPTLSSYFREGGDSSSSCASSAKSTPTHFLSKCAHHSNHLALRQFSDLTLGEGHRKDSLNMSTSSMPPGRSAAGVGVAGVRGVDDPGLGSSSSGAVSSEESVASASSGNSSGYNNNGGVDNCHRPCFDLMQRTSAKPLVNRFILQQKLLLNSERGGVAVDTRPSEDYDPPWDSGPKVQQKSSSSSSSSSITAAPFPPASLCGGRGLGVGADSDTSDASSLTPPMLRTSICDSDQEHHNNEPKLCLERPKRPTLQLSFNKEPAARPSLRTNLSLDLNLNDSSSSSSNSPPKLKRKDFILNFGCPMLSTLPDPVDTTIPLERQGWYHGAISRIEAENLLRIIQEGSYLVRNSESSRNDYSLSLKSARGFMHMKIVSSEGKYILGQFSKPFNSIPEMIHHYSICKLPIKGAEHMSLLHPVIDQLL